MARTRSPLKKEFWRPESDKILVRRNWPWGWGWTINWSAVTKKSKRLRRSGGPRGRGLRRLRA
jgi:hypothetical protein